MLVLPVPLRFDQSADHGDHHGDGDDQHRGRLSHAQLAVHGGQEAPGLLRGGVANDVLVILHVQVAHVLDLAEDALQVAVADPGVAGHLDVGAGGLQLEEGLELDVLQPVSMETQKCEAAQRSQGLGLDGGDVVVTQQEDLQGLLPAEETIHQHVQTVPLQVEEAQATQTLESPHIHDLDAVVTEV